MVLSTWDFEYTLQLQSKKKDILSLYETSQKFIHACLFYRNTSNTRFALCKVYLRYGMIDRHIL